MSEPIRVRLGVEDLLSEVVVRTILRQTKRPFVVDFCLPKRGNSYLQEKISGLNRSARGIPIFVVTDLDDEKRAPLLITKWLPYRRQPNLIFRIAVREIEAWVLAHRSAFARFLGVSVSRIPIRPDEISDPKRALLELAGRSPRRQLREALVPASGSGARVGPDYNGTLSQFVEEEWRATEAVKHSDSLARAWRQFREFEPRRSGVGKRIAFRTRSEIRSPRPATRNGRSP